MAVAVRQENLRRLARRVPVPSYDRARLNPGVVHMSVGSFHRSHQAVYFDALAEEGNLDWGIVGVSYRRRAPCDLLQAQDGLYTVVVRGPERDEARIVGPHQRLLHTPSQPGAVIGALADPRVRLVTLTVTGAGYRANGEDAAQKLPSSVPGLLVAALDRRRENGAGPLTVLSCDNLAVNGAVAREGVIVSAEHRDPALADWIDANVTFPSSVVDRITPCTTEADRAMLAAEFDVDDLCPVVTEPYSQWIVEDEFCAGRPPLDEVGVRFVGDVRPYALIKTRMLNATHCALGYLGFLAGHASTDEAMADPAFSAYVARLLGEVRPLLPRLLGVDQLAHERAVVERIANPRMGDQLSRLCRSGSTKMPQHVLSSISEARARRMPHDALTLAVAAWLRYLRGTDDAGRPHVVEDPAAGRLQRLARADARRLLDEVELFGPLAGDLAFHTEVSACLRALERDGVRGVLSGPESATSVPA